jgi:cell wall-associated NlpC family hydrolase
MESQRASVIAEAMTWLRTPYRHSGRIKGAGADCLTFITGVAENAGVIDRIDIPFYSPQFGLHRTDETYLNGLTQHMIEVGTPQPADVAIWRFGRVWSHAALVIDWPIIIHAHIRSGVTLEDATAPWLSSMGSKPRPVKFFSYW